MTGPHEPSAQAGACISWLFVPGSRPSRFDGAIASGADAVIIDLEDAVAPDLKSQALDHAAAWLSDGGRAWVRVNQVGSPWWPDEVQTLTGRPLESGLLGIVLPKVDRASLEALAGVVPEGLMVLGLVETARGLGDVAQVAAHPAVVRLAFGSVDYGLDIDATATSSIDHARHVLVRASGAAGLPAPVEGVTLDVRNAAAVARQARSALDMGFGGKLCIHPDQVAPIMEAFMPTPAEAAWAERVLDADRVAAGGAFVVDGSLVDAPVLARAARVLDRAARATRHIAPVHEDVSS